MWRPSRKRDCLKFNVTYLVRKVHSKNAFYSGSYLRLVRDFLGVVINTELLETLIPHYGLYLIITEFVDNFTGG